MPISPPAAFGSTFAASIASTTYAHGSWSPPSCHPLAPLELHPATHALHYASTVFEGLKAHRGSDGRVRVFRLGAHAERLRQSAELIGLPVPSLDVVQQLVVDTVRANLDDIPPPPGSMYLRPTLIGTQPNLGAATAPSETALLYVIASPVGDYFAGGLRPLTLAVEAMARTTTSFGVVKAGANYALALRPTIEARRRYGADQVLFCPDGVVQETGASNVLLVDDDRIITPALTSGFLHGVTRDSILAIARSHGYEVEERTLTADELRMWAARPASEIALCGTAAVLAPVGALVFDGDHVAVGSGDVGPNTLRLRELLTDIHRGLAADVHGWCEVVDDQR